jgi:hypothetical protein
MRTTRWARAVAGASQGQSGHVAAFIKSGRSRLRFAGLCFARGAPLRRDCRGRMRIRVHPSIQL